jgi:hypothetical protein
MEVWIVFGELLIQEMQGAKIVLMNLVDFGCSFG